MGDERTAEEIIQMLDRGKATVLKGHGTLTLGHDVQEACLLAILLEMSAQYLMETLPISEPERFSSNEAQRVAAKTFKRSSLERGWGHFKTLALLQFPL